MFAKEIVDTIGSEMRSAEWFEGRDELGLQNCAVLKTLGYSEEFFSGKPNVGIANSSSDLNHCHLGFNALARAVKRGIVSAGGAESAGRDTT
jgi:dihydroxy-acid dehydratase